MTDTMTFEIGENRERERMLRNVDSLVDPDEAGQFATDADTEPGFEEDVSEDDGEHAEFFAARTQAEDDLGISHAEALDRVMDRFDKSKEIRRARELTWWLCVAYFLGDHYVELNKKGDTLIPGTKARVPPYRVRAKINKITPGVVELVGRMVRSMPTLSASPKTEDPEDYDAALSCTAILAHEWKRADCSLVDYEARLWACITGQGGVWTRWNQSAGVVGGETGGPQGECEVSAVSPFQMYPDPSGSRFQSLRWFTLAFDESADDLRESFQALEKDIAGDNSRTESKQYEDQIRSLVGASLGIPYSSETPDDDRTTLLHHYEPRSPKFPRGLMVICTPTAVLWMGPNPWADFGAASNRWCPVEVVRYWEMPGEFWAKGPVEEAIPIQKQLNRTESQILEQRNETTNPGWLMPRGMKIQPGAMSGGPGKEVWFDPPPAERTGGGKVYKPERIEPLPIPSALFKHKADMVAMLEDIFSYHQVSKGAPPMKLSGVAIENLQEADQSGAVPIIQRHGLAWAVVGQRLLTLARENWSDARVVAVQGPEGWDDVRSFRGADIPQHLDVIVDMDVLLPSSRGGKLQALFEMVQNQILAPAEAREAIFSGFPSIRAAVKRASLDQRKQWRENMRMSKGIEAQVAGFDNHQVHLLELNNFRKTPYFEVASPKPATQKVQMQDPMTGEMREVEQPIMRPVTDPMTGMPVVDPMTGQPQMKPATIGDLFEEHAQAHGEALMAALPPDTQVVGGEPTDEGATGPQPGDGGGEAGMGPPNPQQMPRQAA